MSRRAKLASKPNVANVPIGAGAAAASAAQVEQRRKEVEERLAMEAKIREEKAQLQELIERASACVISNPHSNPHSTA